MNLWVKKFKELFELKSGITKLESQINLFQENYTEPIKILKREYAKRLELLPPSNLF